MNVNSLTNSTTKAVQKLQRNFRPRVLRTTILSTILLSIGLIAYQIQSTMWWGILVVFTGALIIGESLELRVINRIAVPVSYAMLMGLARTATNEGMFSWTHVLIVIFASTILSSLCYSDIKITSRLSIFAQRLIVYLVGVFVARTFFDHINPGSQLRYVALITTLCLMIAITEVYAWLQKYPRTYGFFGVAAHASVIAGGVLVGVGYAGTKGFDGTTSPEPFINGLGISALIMCTIPLLVAWFAFARYYGAVKTYKQTIRALAAAPELGGLVSWGHANRVATIALAIAEKLDIPRYERDNIETACYMHTLGDAVLDTTMEEDVYEESEAALVSADIIRQGEGLGRVADIIENHIQPYRGIIDGNLIAQNDVSAAVMRVANDYDNISRKEKTWGIRALQTMLEYPGATYHPKALEALESVLNKDKYADLVEPPSMPERLVEKLYA